MALAPLLGGCEPRHYRGQFFVVTCPGLRPRRQPDGLLQQLPGLLVAALGAGQAGLLVDDLAGLGEPLARLGQRRRRALQVALLALGGGLEAPLPVRWLERRRPAEAQ